MIDGKRLRQIREERGLTRDELAEKVDIGPMQIMRYELGQSDTTGDSLARIAKALGISTDYLLGLVDEPAPQSSGDLRPLESALIGAVRRGDYREAIKILAQNE
jgi:transcriptional regulator with XRE-family HTH domain